MSGDVVPLVPVVLGDRDAGVDAGLSGGHGHVGRVGDEDGPIHQRGAGAGIDQGGEFLEDLGQLVARVRRTRRRR